MKHLRLFLAGCAVMLGLGGLVPAVALADTPKSIVCQTIEAGSDCKSTPKDSTSLTDVIKAVVNILSYLVGVVAVIMVIVSGFKYVTAAGDSSKVSSAKNTLIYAIVGIVIVALSQSIVKFVLNKI